MTIRAPRGEDCQQRLSSMKNTPTTAAKAAATAPAVPSVRTMSQQLWHLAAALMVANFGDGHTSAIHEATGSRPDLNPTGWYDLSGRKIADGPAAATLPHGIYLHQGRKVVK